MNPLLAGRLCVTLDTARLTLEPIQAHHAAEFFPALQDERLYQWISMERPPSAAWLAGHWGKVATTRMAPDSQTAWPSWAVRRRADGVCLGRVDAEIDDSLKAINFGYYFFPPWWGMGYATEAVDAAVAHLEGQGVHRLVATVTEGNTASARVLQKAGFVFNRLLVGNDTIRGALHDDEEYVR